MTDNRDKVGAYLAWQPIYNWSDKLVKLECLSRFQHNGQMVNTGEVLSDMVDYGLSHKLDELIIKNGLQQVCEQIRKNDCIKSVFLQDRVQIVFNVHPTTLIYWATNGYESGFNQADTRQPVDLINEWIGYYCPCLEKQQFGIELLEDGNVYVILKNLNQEISPQNEKLVCKLLFDIVNHLKQDDFKVMIDDFGSQYSNAFRLGLPSSGIKIDGLAVQSATNPSSSAYRDWGMRIIATAVAQVMMNFPHTPEEIVLEHISDECVYDRIRHIIREDCHGELLDDMNRVLFQGYYLGKPTLSLEEALGCD